MRLICGLVVLLALPTIALADLATSVAALDASVDARITAIGDPAPTKAEKKEAKKLGKARKYLARYTGADDRADLKALLKAGKSIAKSRTTDAGISAAVTDVLDDVLALVLAEKDKVVAAVAGLVTPKYVDKVNKKIAKAQSALDKATGYLGADAAKALKGYAKAFEKFLSALAKAVKLDLKDNDGGGGGGGGGGGSWPSGLQLVSNIYSFTIQNNSTQRYYVSDVIVTGDVRVRDSGVLVASPDGIGMRALAPHLFDGQWNLVEKYFTGYPAPLHDLIDYLSPYHDALGVFGVLELDGQVEIRLSKKNDGKSTYSMRINLNDRWF